MDYYKKTIYIPQVDKDDVEIGKVERWEAHKQGILHRGFTVLATYQNLALLQHRMHPLFDGWFDLTCSSHPTYVKGELQSDNDAVRSALMREWNISPADISSITHAGVSYYKVKDARSEYIEHEMCHFFMVKLARMPTPKKEYSHGCTVLPLDVLQDESFPLTQSYAPWVTKLLPLISNTR